MTPTEETLYLAPYIVFPLTCPVRLAAQSFTLGHSVGGIFVVAEVKPQKCLVLFSGKRIIKIKKKKDAKGHILPVFLTESELFRNNMGSAAFSWRVCL